MKFWQLSTLDLTGEALPQTIAVLVVAKRREDYTEPLGGGGEGFLLHYLRI